MHGYQLSFGFYNEGTPLTFKMGNLADPPLSFDERNHASLYRNGRRSKKLSENEIKELLPSIED